MYEGYLESMFYVSKLSTNLFMFGIILNSYLSSMLWHIFHEDAMTQERNILCEYVYYLYTEKSKMSIKY